MRYDGTVSPILSIYLFLFRTHVNYYDSKVYDIINNNRYNQNPKVYACNQCKCVNALTGSYIAFIEEDEFLSNPQKYIDNAYDKSENDADGYNLTKQR